MKADAAAGEGSQRAAEVIELTRGATTAIDGLANIIHDSASQAREISEAVRQQTGGIDQIVSAMTQISSATNAAAGEAAGIERAAASLAEMSRAVGEQVDRYRSAAMDEARARSSRG